MVYQLDVGVTKQKISKFGLAFVAIALAVTAAFIVASTAKAEEPNTEVVTGNTAAGYNEPGWLFNRDASTSTPYMFTKDEASIGAGSLYVEPIGANPADKFIAEYFYMDTAESFTEVSYDFMVGGSGDASDAKHFYLNVYANLPGSPVGKFYDCRFDYVPAAGSTTDFETFTVSKTTAATRVAGAGCPAASEGLDGLPAGSTVRALAINVGDTSANDEGLAGYLDNVVLSTATGATIFDLEPFPANKRECMKGEWASFGFRNQGLCIQYANTGRDSR